MGQCSNSIHGQRFIKISCCCGINPNMWKLDYQGTVITHRERKCFGVLISRPVDNYLTMFLTVITPIIMEFQEQRISFLLSQIRSDSGSASKCSAPPASSAFSCILTTSFKAHDSQQVDVLYMW